MEHGAVAVGRRAGKELGDLGDLRRDEHPHVGEEGEVERLEILQ